MYYTHTWSIYSYIYIYMPVYKRMSMYTCMCIHINL